MDPPGRLVNASFCKSVLLAEMWVFLIGLLHMANLHAIARQQHEHVRMHVLQVNALVLGTTHRYQSKYVTTVSSNMVAMSAALQ